MSKTALRIFVYSVLETLKIVFSVLIKYSKFELSRLTINATLSHRIFLRIIAKIIRLYPESSNFVRLATRI